MFLNEVFIYFSLLYRYIFFTLIQTIHFYNDTNCYIYFSVIDSFEICFCYIDKYTEAVTMFNKNKTVCDGTFIDIVLTLCNVCVYKYCNYNETVENVSIKE